MEFEKPDLPVPESPEATGKKSKKGKRKSRKQRDILGLAKKAEASEAEVLPVDEIVADLLAPEKPDKKRKKSKAKEAEPAEIIESQEPEARAPEPYVLDAEVEIPLAEIAYEAEISLRLPEIPEQPEQSTEKTRVEPMEGLLPEEIAEEDNERLAAERAGIELAVPPAEKIETPMSPAQTSSSTERTINKPVAEIIEIDEEMARRQVAESVGAPIAKTAETVPAPPQATPNYLSGAEIYQEWQERQRRRRVRKLWRERPEVKKRLEGTERDIQTLGKGQKSASERLLDAAHSPLAKPEVAVLHRAERFTAAELPEEALAIQEQLHIPAEHRLERSAWHSIEVDKKTGRVVERPTIDYGEEFKRETHQEAKDHEEEELAVASGQLAVGTLANLSLLAGQAGQTVSNLAGKSRALYNKIENTIPLGSSQFSLADLWLWLALTIIIIAIIIASH